MTIPNSPASVRERSRRIYLTGFMASGKSTIGPILANTLGYNFVDIDKLIEEREGQTIVQIFQERGEQYFRAVEREVLREASCLEGYVISLGGGTILQPENLSLMFSTGLLVYLHAGTEQLLRRLRHKTDRPVLQGSSGGILPETELRAKIEELLASRSSTYGKADIIIETDGSTVGKTVDQIVHKLAPFLGS